MGKHKLDKLFSDKLRDREYTPDATSWDQLEDVLAQKSHKNIWPWIGIAASAVLAIFSSWYFLRTESTINEIEYAHIEEQGGFSPLHDKSSPELIQRTLGVSKKTFKSTVGNLMKKGKITIEKEGIRLK